MRIMMTLQHDADAASIDDMLLQARTLDDAIDAIRPWLRIHHEGLDLQSSAIEVRGLSID